MIEWNHLGRSGSVETIVGCMFSGKTEELMRLLRRAQYAKQRFQVFKPRIDDRYSKDHVASHNRALMASTVIERAEEIFRHLKPGTQVVGVDEGQFFDEELVDVANELADRGLRVIVAGLDLNWKGEPFRPMPDLMAISERVTKLSAVCMKCGASASRTQRLALSAADVLVGDASTYEARCRACHEPEISELMIEEAALDVVLPPSSRGEPVRGAVLEFE